jgi:hypothetical protein
LHNNVQEEQEQTVIQYEVNGYVLLEMLDDDEVVLHQVDETRLVIPVHPTHHQALQTLLAQTLDDQGHV